MQHLHVSSVGMLMSVDVLWVGFDMSIYWVEWILTWVDIDLNKHCQEEMFIWKCFSNKRF